MLCKPEITNDANTSISGWVFWVWTSHACGQSPSEKGVGMISQMFPQHPVIVWKDHCEGGRFPEGPCGSISNIHQGHAVPTRQTSACMGQPMCIASNPGSFAKSLSLDGYCQAFASASHNLTQLQENTGCSLQLITPLRGKKYLLYFVHN